MTVREQMEAKYGKPTMTVRQQMEAKYGKPVVEEIPEEKSFLRKAGDFFTESSQKFGTTLGTAMSVIDPEVNKNRDATLKLAQDQSALYLDLAKKTKDKKKKDALIKASMSAGDTSKDDIFTGKEYQKSAKQIYGEGLGTLLEATSLGSFGSASKAPTALKPLLTPGKTILKGTITGAKTGAAYGGVYGAGFSAADALQADASGSDIAKEALKGLVTGGVAGGVIGGALGAVTTSAVEGYKAGKKLVNKGVAATQKKLGIGSIENIVNKREKELYDIENNYAKTRKSMDYKKDAGAASRRRIAKTDVLVNSVDDTGTIKTKGAGGAIEQYKAQTIDGREGTVRKLLENEGATVRPEIVKDKIVSNVMKSGLEGKALTSAINNVDDEIAGLMLRATPDGNIPLVNVHDAKISTANSINWMTEPSVKAERKSIARTYKELIEETSNQNIKSINEELTKFYQDLDLLANLDGKKVKGGKLGKYFAQIAGNIIGGAVGSAGGPFGSAAGAVAGGEAASKIKGSMMKRTFGKITGQAAKKSKILEEAFIKSEAGRLLLPKPKYGPQPEGGKIRSKIESGPAIKLPSKSQSTIDKLLTPKRAEKPIVHKVNDATVIDPDLFKKQYNDFDQANHHIYSKMAQKQLTEQLPKNSNPIVKFTAGGSGGGKSDIIIDKISKGFNGIIVDGTFSRYESIAPKLKQVMDAGKKIEVHAILPNVDNAWKYVIKRGLATNRFVPKDIFIGSHTGVIDTLKKVLDNFPNVKMFLTDTRRAYTMEDALKVKKISDSGNINVVLNDIKYNTEKLVSRLEKVSKDSFKVDFSKEGSFGAFKQKGRNYMIASAENPMGTVQDTATNIKRTQEFRKFLENNGIEYQPQKGVYGGAPEESNLITIRNAEQRKLIDNWLEKNSPQAENIIVKNGKVIRYDPRTKEAYGVDLRKTKAEVSRPDTQEDFYSEISGRKYAFPLYDDKFERAIDKKTFLDYYNK